MVKRAVTRPREFKKMEKEKFIHGGTVADAPYHINQI